MSGVDAHLIVYIVSGIFLVIITWIVLTIFSDGVRAINNHYKEEERKKKEEEKRRRAAA